MNTYNNRVLIQNVAIQNVAIVQDVCRDRSKFLILPLYDLGQMTPPPELFKMFALALGAGVSFYLR